MIKEQRTLRVAQFMFLAYAGFLFWLIHAIKPQQPVGQLTPVHKKIALLAVVDCVIAIVLRRGFLSGSMEKPRNDVTVNPVKRWFMANVLGLAFAMSTCLFGLMLHVLGAPDWLAQALVGLGIAVMIGFMFGRPPAEQPADSPYGTIE